MNHDYISLNGQFWIHVRPNSLSFGYNHLSKPLLWKSWIVWCNPFFNEKFRITHN